MKHALTQLLDAAREAVDEETEFWADQTITEDNRPPQWIERLRAAIEQADSMVVKDF